MEERARNGRSVAVPERKSLPRQTNVINRLIEIEISLTMWSAPGNGANWTGEGAEAEGRLNI